MAKDRNLGLLHAVQDAWAEYEATYDEALGAMSDNWLLLSALRAPRKYNRRAERRPTTTDLGESAKDLEAALRKLSGAREKVIAAQAAYDARNVEDD